MKLSDALVVTTIPVTDLDLARDFYSRTLGLKILVESGPSILFEAGDGTRLGVYRRSPTKADHTVCHFEVHDLEATIRDLEARGVEFLDYDAGPLQTVGHIAQFGAARGAWFNDPFGNILGLREG